MALMVAALTVVLVGVMAFVTDFGLAYANQRNLQNGTDAAVLSIGQDIASSADRSDDCADIEAAANTTATRNTAAAWLERNVAAVTAGLSEFSVRCESVNGVDQVVIHAVGEQRSPTFFGPIFDVNYLDVAREARAIVGPAESIIGLRPFGLCEELVENLRDLEPGPNFTIDFANDDRGCGAASGNFGTLDLRPSPDGAPGGLPEGWTRDGYPDPISVTDPMIFQGKPGTPSNNFGDDFHEILGDPIVVPVYDEITDRGSFAEYHITGYVSVKVCGARLGPGQHYPGPCLVEDAITADTHATWVQVQFTKYIPTGELALGCSLGDDCDSGLRVVKLAD